MRHIVSRYNFILLFLISACTTVPEEIDGSDSLEASEAHWITDGIDLPVSDSLFYLEHPAPLFRKEFNLDQEIDQAILSITAAGYYLASINGSGVGKNVLDPAWTDYSKRIYYTEYDVTSLVKEGNNCIGVSLGNGFYNPLPLRKWGRRNLRTDTRVGKPTFISKLKISYPGGKSEEILSDTSWKYFYGPIRKNDVYLGVAYEANKEIEGWNSPGFSDELWQSVNPANPPEGKLQKSFFPPVQVTKEITPQKIYSADTELWMVDMGVNFTGTYRIKLTGNTGDTITFRFGERIYEDGTLNPMTTVAGQIKRKGVGGPGAPDIAWQTDSYIIGDTGKGVFEPEFTYHTYRYMEISGLQEKPEPGDIKGLVFHTNVTDNNSFFSSSELLNSIQEVTERTFLSNLISVQSDCPAREKFGYGGDINATSEAFIYNFDMKDFYRKTVYDWVDAMKDSSFVDTAPFVGIEYCGISWESAFMITQNYLYLYYNDTAIISELYELNKKWMDKVARIHPEGIVDEGLSDHESLEPVPVQLTGTAHYLQCARIMIQFASVMGDKDGEEKYKKLAEELKNLIRIKFWDHPVMEEINRQTLFSTLLYHDIIPVDEIPAARDSLMIAVKNGPASHFNTGIFGTKYVLEALSKYGTPEEVFKVVNSTEFPGWGHMVDRGATTLWETWEESDNVFSNNHPMFGSVSEWFYRWLAGIRPDPKFPGFKEFLITPSTPEGLDFVNCTYNSPYGSIVSNWRKEPSGNYHFEMTVPDGSLAHVDLPVSANQHIEIEKAGTALPPVIPGLETGTFDLEGGQYFITVAPLDP